MGNYTAKTSQKTLVVDGFEKQVDELLKARELIDTGEAALEALRPEVQSLADERRVEASAVGEFVKTVALTGSQGRVMFSFGNRFCTIPEADESAIRADIGDRTYGELFGKKVAASVKPEALQDLLALLGDEAEDYLDVVKTVVPVQEFREARFRLRKELSTELNQKLDEVIHKVAAKPTMKMKPNA